MSSIAQAVLAAMNVDQQAVQSATKGTVTRQFAAPDVNADQAAYEQYRTEQQTAGRPALPLVQWRIVNRGTRLAQV